KTPVRRSMVMSWTPTGEPGGLAGTGLVARGRGASGVCLTEVTVLVFNVATSRTTGVARASPAACVGGNAGTDTRPEPRTSLREYALRPASIPDADPQVRVHTNLRLHLPDRPRCRPVRVVGVESAPELSDRRRPCR